MVGIDLFDALGGKARLTGIDLTAPLAASMSLTSSQSSLSLDQFPVLIKPTSGLLIGFIHRPTVDITVKPVRQKFWHPPLAKQEPIATKLARLEKESTVTHIDASPWTSNVVTAKNKYSRKKGRWQLHRRSRWRPTSSPSPEHRLTIAWSLLHA